MTTPTGRRPQPGDQVGRESDGFTIVRLFSRKAGLVSLLVRNNGVRRYYVGTVRRSLMTDAWVVSGQQSYGSFDTAHAEWERLRRI